MAYAWEPRVIQDAARSVLVSSGRYHDLNLMEREVLNLSAIMMAAGRMPMDQWPNDLVVSRFVAGFEPNLDDIQALRDLLMGTD